MHTRKEYMDGKISHQQFYGEIAKALGISFDDSERIDKLVEAYKADKNFNTIPLRIWDMMGFFSKDRMAKELKKRGSGWSFANSVCIYKAAARESVEKILNIKKEIKQ